MPEFDYDAALSVPEPKGLAHGYETLLRSLVRPTELVVNVTGKGWHFCKFRALPGHPDPGNARQGGYSHPHPFMSHDFRASRGDESFHDLFGYTPTSTELQSWVCAASRDLSELLGIRARTLGWSSTGGPEGEIGQVVFKLEE